MALAIDNALAYEKVAEARNQLNTEKTYLEDEIRYDRNLEDIVGKSRALRETLSKAEVSPRPTRPSCSWAKREPEKSSSRD